MSPVSAISVLSCIPTRPSPRRFSIRSPGATTWAAIAAMSQPGNHVRKLRHARNRVREFSMRSTRRMRPVPDCIRAVLAGDRRTARICAREFAAVHRVDLSEIFAASDRSIAELGTMPCGCSRSAVRESRAEPRQVRRHAVVAEPGFALPRLRRRPARPIAARRPRSSDPARRDGGRAIGEARGRASEDTFRARRIDRGDATLAAGPERAAFPRGVVRAWRRACRGGPRRDLSRPR